MNWRERVGKYGLVGIIQRFIKGEQLMPVIDAPTLDVTFTTDIDSGVLYGEPTLDDHIYGTTKVSRKTAMTVPAVKRSRDLIAGGIGQFPLQLLDANSTPVEWPLFTQLEPDVAPSVSITRIVADLLFHGKAWLRITKVGWHGRPVEVRRLDPSSVTIGEEWLAYTEGTAIRNIPSEHVIRIDGPSEGLLETGAVAINTYLQLAAATRNATGALPPMSYFAPVDDADSLDEDEIKDLLDDWAKARAKRATAYVPAALQLNTLGWSPEQLTLTDLRDQAVLEIARLVGVDPEELGVSTTSRTYANAADRHRQFLDYTLGPIMTAIEGRLSMNDVTPAGYRADFDTTAFLRADDLTRAQTDSALIAAGILTVNEARAARSLPPVNETPKEPTDND